MTRMLISLMLILAWAGNGFGQAAILQSGPVSPGHAPMYVNSGTSQPVVQDSGGAAGGATGVGLSELGITARGTGTPPYVGQGKGPNGTNACDYDAPINNPAGYHYLCWSPNATGNVGTIVFGHSVSAASLPFNFVVNGVSYPFPFVVGGIVGPPSSTVGHAACWNNTVGTLLSDCGVPLTGPGSATINDIAIFSNVGGTAIADGGKQLPSGLIVGTTDAQSLTNKSITPFFADLLTATGTNQGTALAISKTLNVFRTTPSGTGAILPTTDPNGVAIGAGYTAEILNRGSNSLGVYPPSGQTINGGATNASVSIYANADAKFTYRGAGDWYAQ